MILYVEFSRIVFCHLERGGGNIGGKDADIWDICGDGDCDCTRACANIRDGSFPWMGLKPGDCFFDKQFRFRAGDEHIFCDVEFKPEEFPFPQHIGERFARLQFFQRKFKVLPLFISHRMFRVREHPGAWFLDNVGKYNLRVELGSVTERPKPTG